MVSVGDEIQWTVNGVDQFAAPKKVRIVSDCGEYCFVEGSDTGLPVAQVTIRPVTPDPVPETVIRRQPSPKMVVQEGEQPENFTFFWRGPFSQWHPSRFESDGVVYNCAEQFMMASKARMFGDEITLKKIMLVKEPSLQKKFGRAVTPFDPERWNKVAKKIVYTGNALKFMQNRTLLVQLLATDGTTLVEASPYDSIWGIGLAAHDIRAQDRATWLGTNWLGEILTRLRDNMIASVREFTDSVDTGVMAQLVIEKMKIDQPVA